MRKPLLIIFIILPLLIFGILILKNHSTTPQKPKAEDFSPTPIGINNSIEVDGFTVSWFEIDNIDNLKLIPNFSEKLSSKEVIQKNNCKLLSNGPFYATNENGNHPLGLFITNGDRFYPWSENSLFDGILSINEMAIPRITRLVPEDKLNIAIQAGPILKENNSFQTLKIQNDSESRRVVALITGTNKLFFMTIYDKNSQYSGPLLTNLPNVLKSFEQKSGIVFADAINLDGGSASSFHSESIHLSEISPTGAFFCQL